jgi:hypothetical protein
MCGGGGGVDYCRTRCYCNNNKNNTAVITTQHRTKQERSKRLCTLHTATTMNRFDHTSQHHLHTSPPPTDATPPIYSVSCWPCQCRVGRASAVLAVPVSCWPCQCRVGRVSVVLAVSLSCWPCQCRVGRTSVVLAGPCTLILSHPAKFWPKSKTKQLDTADTAVMFKGTCRYRDPRPEADDKHACTHVCMNGWMRKRKP